MVYSKFIRFLPKIIFVAFLSVFSYMVMNIMAGDVADAFSVQEEEGSLFAPPEGFEPLKVTGDALSWDVFATTEYFEKCVDHSDGFLDCEIKPKYSEDILKFDGKEVTLMGFMFPFSEGDDQANFLMGAYPLSCPFEYHSPPSLIVEVLAEKNPVKFSFDPVTVKGILEVRYEKETGIFYYLKAM